MSGEGPGLHERDIAVMVGEVKGIVTQVLSQVTSLTSQLQALEATTNSRVGLLEQHSAQLRTSLDALSRKHDEDVRRLESARKDEQDAARAAAARKPSWTAIAAVVFGATMALIAVLSFGDVIGAGG